MKKLMLVMAAVAVSGMVGTATAGAKQDIVETAVSNGSFKTLAAALGAADLIDTLKGDGPFTVFAPTDEAFAKLPKGTVESLLKPENKAQLAAILAYHVVPGDVRAKQVVKIAGAKTVNGQRVDIKVVDGGVTVDNANVTATDIVCANGVIHVIDQVILPAGDNLVATADNAGSFKTLLTAAKAAGLADTLSSDGPFTIFAPTDEAFAKLPEGTVASLLEPKNKAKLAAILKYHVVAGRVYSEDALTAGQAKTLLGESVQIHVSQGAARVNEATLVATDIDAANGVIHVIDQVLLPPEKKVDAKQARHMIEQAVEKGVPLFNAGHHQACAKIYMTTMQELLEYGDEMPAELLGSMQSVVTHASHTSSAVKRAWALRHGLNHAYHRMGELE